MEQILRQIYKLSGLETLNDGRRLMAYFADIAPKEKEGKKLLLLFLKCDGNLRLISAQKIPACQQAQVIKDLLNDLTRNAGLSPQQAEYVCQSFWSAIGGNEKNSFNVNNYPSEDFSQRVIPILKKTALLPAVILILCCAVIYGGHIGKEKEWSEWTTELPKGITSENYDISDKTVYSFRTLQTATSDSDTMEDWELYDTTAVMSDYSEWSEWSEEEAFASALCNVESKEQYRCREFKEATSDREMLTGWELVSTETIWSDYGGWSDWTESPVSDDEFTTTESKIQYRYRSKEHTTADTDTLEDGWILEQSHQTGTEYGSWSDWSTDYVSADNNVEVEQQDVLLQDAKTKYVYGAYFSSNSAKPYAWTHFCGKCGHAQYGGQWEYKTYTQSHPAEVSHLGQRCGHGYVIDDQYRADDGYLYYFQDIQTTDAVYETQYRYRYLSPIYEYNYYRWDDWSSYSDTPVYSSEDCEVETRTLYRYKQREEILRYHMIRYDDWSQWSDQDYSHDDNVEIETQTLYRHQDRELIPVYHFQKWSEWSDYSTQPITEDEHTQVQEMILYSYKEK